MALEFYKISSEALHLQRLRTTALLGQIQRPHVMALTIRGTKKPLDESESGE